MSVKDIFKQIFSVGIGVLFGIFLSVLAATGLYIATRQPEGQPVILLPTASPQPIVVYVLGAVNKPGVYNLPPNSRIMDAAQAAGGFAEGADMSQINVAEPVRDGQRLELPGTGEFPTPEFAIANSGLVLTATPRPGGKVNINTADAELLDTLPHIGPTLAKKIIEYREENGPFQSIDDLKKVAGIGEKTFEDIKPFITIDEAQENTNPQN